MSKKKRSPKAVRQDRAPKKDLVVQARFYYDNGDYQRCEKYLQQFLQEDSDAPAKLAETYFLLGKIRDKAQDLESAASFYALSVKEYEINPDSFVPALKYLYRRLAAIYRHHEDLESLCVFKCKLMRISPEDAESYVDSSAMLLGFANSWKMKSITDGKVSIRLPDDVKDDYICRDLLNNLSKIDDSKFIQFLAAFLSEIVQTRLAQNPQAYQPLGVLIRERLAQNFSSQGKIEFFYQYFHLPSLFQRWHWQAVPNEGIFKMLAVLEQQWADNNTISPLGRLSLAVALLLVRGLCGRLAPALEEFLTYYNAQRDNPLIMVCAAPLWHTLYSSGWFSPDDNDDTLKSLLRQQGEDFFRLLPGLQSVRAYLLLESFCYLGTSERAWNELIFNEIIVPVARQALITEDYTLAEIVTTITDYTYAHQPYTEEQVKLCWDAYAGETLAAASRVVASLSPPPWPAAQSDAPPVVAFVINHFFHVTSVSDVLLFAFKGILAQDPPLISPVIYAFAGITADLKQAFESVGVRVTDMDEIRGMTYYKHYLYRTEDDAFLPRLLALREVMQQDGVVATVYPLNRVFFMAFASIIGLSPVHIYWAMGRYHTFHLDEIQGYISGNGNEPTKMIYGREWRQLANVSLAFSEATDPNLIEQAETIRKAQFGAYEIVLGCIVRPDKIDNDTFMDVLTEILHANPKTVFLWFGRQEMSSVKDKMQRRGIYERCLYQGWVDTSLYLHVIDIFLDSFPFPAGIVAHQAFLASKPVVFYQSKEAEELSIARLIQPILDQEKLASPSERPLTRIFSDNEGENLFLYANSPAEYRDSVQKLIDNTGFRVEVGQAGKNYMRSEFISGGNKYGESLAEHILDIISKKKSIAPQAFRPSKTTSATQAVPFGKPFVVGKELYYIAQAVYEMHLSGDGPFTKRCHAWFERQLGCTAALLTHSCTAALEMAAILCDINAGDEVIIPSFTFVSTANAFVLRGGIPVFTDIHFDTLNIDENLLENAITPRTKAIVPVHYAGRSCDMDVILAIARHYGLYVIEDAAQALLATHKGRALGTLGDLGCLSFHETKNIISGEGGALLINREELVARAEIIREKGTDRSRFFRGETDKYTWQDIGSSYLPSELVSAFLYAQLEHAEQITATRRRAYEKYYRLLKPLEEAERIHLPLCDDNNCTGNGHLFYLLASTRTERDNMLHYLRTQGVHAVFHYLPLHLSPAGRRYGRAGSCLGVTEDVSGRLLRLPLYYEITDEEIEYVVGSVYSFFQ